MKKLFLMCAVMFTAIGLSAQLYSPQVTLTDLGGDSYELKVEVELPAGETGSITLNQLNGVTRNVEVDVVEGVPINGTHIETYSVTITRGPNEDEVVIEVYKAKKKKGVTTTTYSGI